MKQAEYVGEVLGDGHLSLPEAVRKELDLQPSALVQVVLSVPEADKEEMQEAWKLFQEMGREATPGRLPKAAAEHDRYLYGRKEP